MYFEDIGETLGKQIAFVFEPKNITELLIGREPLAVQADEDHAYGGLVEGDLEALLAVGQSALGAMAEFFFSFTEQLGLAADFERFAKQFDKNRDLGPQHSGLDGGENIIDRPQRVAFEDLLFIAESGDENNR